MRLQNGDDEPSNVMVVDFFCRSRSIKLESKVGLKRISRFGNGQRVGKDIFSVHKGS